MKLRNSILLWLLTLLGFGSCSGIKTIVISKPDNHDYPAPEYGVPMADYRIMGTVTDRDGNPVKGARVAVDPLAEEWARDTVYTNEKGEYLKIINDGADYGSTLPLLKVNIEDVDGMDNGGIFQPKELRINDFTVEKTKDASGWYAGQYTLIGNTSVEMFVDDVVEYGVPHADFRIIGTVTDKDDKPIKGIRVDLSPNYSDWGRDTLYTDDNGEYVKELHGEMSVDGTLEGLVVQLEDIDGAANGGFFDKKDLRMKDFTSEQTEKGSGWYNGKFTLTNKTQLEPYYGGDEEYGPPPAGYKKIK